MFLSKYNSLSSLNVFNFPSSKINIDYSYNVIKIVVKDITKDCKWNTEQNLLYRVMQGVDGDTSSVLAGINIVINTMDGL